MNGKSPDVEKAADALDAANTHAPPGLYTSGEPLCARGPRGTTTTRSRAVPSAGRLASAAAASASPPRAPCLALGRYGINWDFDDWRGYVAERVRFLNAVTSASNRALVLGGDSHDAWAGVIPNDRETWGLGYDRGGGR